MSVIYQWLARVRREIKRKTMLTPLDPIVSRLATGLAMIGPRLLPSVNKESEMQIAAGYFLKLPAGLPSARRVRIGLYEPEVTKLMCELLAPGMTLVDVGANIGYYTLMGARLVAPTGRVYAFEPEIAVYKYLVMNIARNRAQNVTPVPKAVADSAGSFPFTSSALEGGFLSNSSMQVETSTPVDTVSLDGFFSAVGWPSIDVIKLDVEGAEGRALKGMRELSARSRGLRLVMECNLKAVHRAGLTPRDMTDLLTGLGFVTAYVIEQDMRPISLADALPPSGLIYNLLIAKQ